MAIEDSDREKYIERSVLVNMTLLRKTAAEKAMTGAINRVIRALTGLKGQYTKAELSKPFAIPRVTFSPDYNDPEVKKAILSQGMNSIGSLFGTPTLPQIEKISSTETGPVFNPEEFADNPAFASEQNETDIPHETDTPEETENNQTDETGYCCDECGTSISDKVYEYSLSRFGRPLCIKCQKGAGK